MFLITGCGRSGTTYITTALQRCGLDVGHERYGRDGIVSGFYAVDAPRYPGRHPNPRPLFDVVLHQVRHPLRTIASVTTGRSMTWAQPFVPVEPGASTLRWACYYWLAWNRAAEGQAAFTYRIEALEAAWPKLQEALGFDAGYSVTAGIPRAINARRHRRVTWAGVHRAAPEIYADIRALALRYGYTLEEKEEIWQTSHVHYLRRR